MGHVRLVDLIRILIRIRTNLRRWTWCVVDSEINCDLRIDLEYARSI